MATRYVDPSASSNGTGTAGSPYNTPVGATLDAGDSLLFKCGTTWLATGRYQPTNTGTASAPITIGSYGNGPLPILHGQDSVDIAIQITDHAHYVIEDIEFQNYTRCGPYLGSTGDDDTRVRNTTIRRCVVHGILGDSNGTGIQGWGTGITIQDCVISRTESDGIWMRGANLTIKNNNISLCSYNAGGQGDCIQIDNCDTGLLIQNNYIDHTRNGDKQALLIRQEGGGQSAALVIGNTIVGTTVVGSGLVTVQGALGVNFIGNRFEFQNNAAIFYLKEGSNLAQGVVMGNLFLGNGTQGRAVSSDDPSGVISAYCNTIIGTDQGLVLGTQGKAANNICHTQARAAIYAEAYKKNNCIFNNTTSGGMTYDGTHVTDDPLLDASYRPRAGSPVIGAGTYIPGAKHFGGVPMNAGAPDIGAHRYFEAREIAASRTVRRV